MLITIVERIASLTADARLPLPDTWLRSALKIPFAIVSKLAPADVAAFVAAYPYLNSAALVIGGIAIFSLIPPLRALVSPYPRKMYTVAVAGATALAMTFLQAAVCACFAQVPFTWASRRARRLPSERTKRRRSHGHPSDAPPFGGQRNAARRPSP